MSKPEAPEEQAPSATADRPAHTPEQRAKLDRAARLASALRDNLRRRKAAARTPPDADKRRN